jgi:uncharacterized membrane protein YcaP (DUF421 family)
MFDLSLSLWELIARAVAVYVFLLACMRYTGKKHVGQLSPFDLVVLLILSETVSGSLIADDKSLLGGFISAATLLLLAHAVGYATWRNKHVERFLEGTPRFLVRHGHVDRDVMAEEQVTHSELIEALRRQGHTSLTNIRYAVLENDGTITVGVRVER